MRNFSAKTIKGEGRGKKIGYPTINLDPVNINMDYGVYLVEVFAENNRYKGLLHFGHKKTFNGAVSAEIYIENNLDVLPKNVIIKAVRKIRDIRKFKDVEELKRQIKKDIRCIGN